MPAIAAIDLGSNAIRLAVGVPDPSTKTRIVEEHREPVRLGEEVFKNGLIPEEAIRRVETTFSKFLTIMQRFPVQEVRAVATSAVREARNRDDFVARIQSTTGIKIEVINGEEEARLVYLAVRQAVDLKGKLALLVDIGGGSVEISLVKNGEIVISETLKMGAVRLYQMLDGRKRGQKIFYRLTRSYVDAIKRKVKKDLRGRSLDLVVGTGGNVEALGDLRCKLCDKKDSRELYLKDLDKVVKRLSELSVEERIEKLGLRPDRADVVFPAAIMVQEILRHTGVKRLIIPKVGLKNGVLGELISARMPRSPEANRRMVLNYAREVGRRFNFDEPHALNVSKWAVKLFQDLAPIHQCPPESRLLFEVAALLHDIGHAVNSNGHHKHSCYLIRSSPLIGLTERERQIAACIARYHRKSAPQLSHAEFAALKPEDRPIVVKLAAILRIADALDSGHVGAVKSIRLQRNRDEIQLALRGSGDLLFERWSIAHKTKLFEETFKMKIQVKE